MTPTSGAPATQTTLSGLRVVELAGDVGGYAGKLFADLGADVVHVETPGGDPVRLLPPFLGGGPDGTSLTYLYQNTNKRGLAIDLERPDGRDVLRKVVSVADVFLEGAAPRGLDGIGLGPDDTRAANPRLTHVSITPFGHDGPYRDRPASDLTCMAAGGMLYLSGTGDEKPVLAYGQQAYLMGSLYAALGALVAVYHAEETGTGQYVDISLQDCVATGLESAAQAWNLDHTIRRASGGTGAGFGMYRCADGYVYLAAAIGTAAYYWTALVDWMAEEGAGRAQELRASDWYRPDFRETPAARETFRAIFEEFACRHPKQRLYEVGQARKVICYPVNTPMDVFQNAQLRYREFFQELDGVTYPGPCYRFETTPWELRRPAPRFGEHSAAILAELGYAPSDIRRLVDDRAVFV